MSTNWNDRNDPKVVSWLDLCRSWRPDLTSDEFEELVPEFITMAKGLEAAKALREMH